MKILGSERNGFWPLLKRLEKDKFIRPSETAVPSLTVEPLHWLLWGIDIGVVQRHPQRLYERVDYLHGLPLYRQAALLGCFGGTTFSRNTLAASVVRTGQAVPPVINLLRDALLESRVVHGNETEVQVPKEPGRKARSNSYM